jgi:transcriptional regulator with XRE-family HTH domain
LSYRQLCERMTALDSTTKVSATTLFSYETGRARPRPPKLKALADALGCDTTYLAPLPKHPSLRDHREHAGLFLRDIAAAVGVADSTVMRMEDGTHWPDEPDRWAAAYGLTLKGFAEAWRPI